MRNYILISIILTMVLLPLLSYSQESPEAMMNQAIGNLRTASNLVERAKEVLSNNPGVDNLRTGIHLYAEAGRGFEKAAQIFAALGTDYVKQSDIDNCNKAVQSCLATIEQCKNRLQALNSRK